MPVLSHFGACAAGPLFPPKQYNIAVNYGTSPWAMGWPFNMYSGFGTKYADPTASGSSPGASSYQTAANHPNNSGFMWSQSTSACTAYRFGDAGWGSAYGSGMSTVASGRGVTWSKQGTTVAAAGATNGIFAAPWTEASGFGTEYTAPASNPTANNVAFHPLGTYLFSHYTATPFVGAYPFSTGGGIGTKISDPGTTFSSASSGLDVSVSGSYVFVGGNSSPYVYAYPFTTSWGTPISNPGTLPTGQVLVISATPDGTKVICHMAASPYVHMYAWSDGAWGTKYSDPTGWPAGVMTGSAVSKDSSVGAFAYNATPYVYAFPISGSGWGTKYANPGTVPGSQARGVTFGN